jgi:hypothetical protein
MLVVASSLSLSAIEKIVLKPVRKGLVSGKEVVSGNLFKGPTIVFAVRRPG